MSIRARVATAAAGAVVLAVLLVGGLLYAATARQVRLDLDDELLAAARLVQGLAPGSFDELVGGGRGGPGGRGRLAARLPAGAVQRLLGPLGGGIVQLVEPDLDTRTIGDVELPVDEATARLATGVDEEPTFVDAEVAGRDVRVVAVAVDGGGAVQVAAPADRAAPALSALRRQLVLAGGLAAVLAAGLGLLVADGALRPLRRLADTATTVGRTADLSTRIDEEADDEIGRLASSFNEMLAGLEGARAAQQQLVADASHELRTPLTSLRTNLDVLQLGGDLDPQEREALLRDLTGQLEELGRLVDGLVELARGDRPALAPTPVVLGDVVDEVVDRYAVSHPSTTVNVEADGSVVLAERDRLERAVSNLVDNAIKHGGGSPVEVVVREGCVTVRDHGPGIPVADLPHVLERFYRAPSARRTAGSGLGLSIVAQVAAAHDGEVTVANHPGGGAVVRLALPVA